MRFVLTATAMATAAAGWYSGTVHKQGKRKILSVIVLFIFLIRTWLWNKHQGKKTGNLLAMKGRKKQSKKVKIEFISR
jgi:hypothetical protein